ncbi:MAG: glycoside hydrolase TIM-barrel-like domain-containing protein [Alphaproteobacteria bacterium]|nr:glycoside hydrolase TIM-barrel-like domain-containing protein [Alphaproteobacteria bacterium]
MTDGTYGKPWVFRFKDIRDWWSNVHYDRPGGKQNNLLPDSDNPQSANWTATGATKTGIGGTHLNYFTLAADVASGGGALHRVARSTAAVIASGSYRVTWLFKAGTSGKRYLRLACSGNSLEISGAIGAVPSYTNSGFTYSNFIEADLGGGYWRAQIDVITGAAAALAVQIGPNSGTAGQTITFVGGDVVRLDASSAASTGWVPKSKPIRFTEAGCPAVDKGANQPNVFVDPKSSESQYPYYSKGNRDDAIQRRFLEALHHYWNANNPAGGLYGGPMLDLDELAVWCWDARPYPAFPGRSDVWGDYQNWQFGHWLTGRLGASSLSALVRELCVRGGLAEADIDAEQLSATVPGYVITALESARGSIEPLARFYGFDATESAGLIRFVPRGTAPVVTITAGDLAIRSRADEDIELVRAQETELPLALKWRCLRMDEDYGGMTVEARRITVDTARVTSESFAIATAGAEADMRCRRSLIEAWVQRETAKLQLPPSRLAFDPADVVLIEHDGRQLEFRLASIADQDARIVEALRTDAVIYGARPGPERVPNLPKPVVFGPPVVALMDLPILDEDVPDHRPFAAVFASPWYGQAAVYRSPTEDGFTLLDMLGRPARMGTLSFDLYGGPASRFDLGNQLYVDLLSGTLASVSDLDLFAGNNSLAIESSAGVWEIVQFANAELVATNRYKLTRLLRGQRGTEVAIGKPAPVGSRVVVLDDALAPVSIASTDLNLAYNWRIGPASKDPADPTYVQLAFMPKGIGRRPYSAAHVSQPWKFARTPGDLTISWKRRTRAVAGDSWEAIEVPLFEESESYEVDILDGATIKRTLASITANVVYTGAQQIADWGALLVPGNSLQVAIYQLSAQFGRGARKLETLYF